MKIIKRSGVEVEFDIEKIVAAVKKANNEVPETDRLSEAQIRTMSENVENICSSISRTLGVEEIQDLVENEIMNIRNFDVARKYITYRYKRSLVRKSNSTDKQILSLIECNNEEVKQENSNKNPVRTLPSVFCCRMILSELMKMVLYTFMIPIILHSICTIAAL